VLGLHERPTLCCAGAVAFPVRDSVTELVLVVNDKLALAVPEELGKNVTVNPADWPAAKVIGRLSPLTVNSVLVTLAREIVTDDPLAVNVPFSVALAPVTTLPKFKAVGVSCNWPDAAPLPDNPMLS